MQTSDWRGENIIESSHVKISAALRIYNEKTVKVFDKDANFFYAFSLLKTM